MERDTHKPDGSNRSRREVLGAAAAGVVGALAAVATESVVKAPSASAANGNPLYLGTSNSSTLGTDLTSTATNYGLYVESTSSLGSGIVGVCGGSTSAGVQGINFPGSGVQGQGTKGVEGLGGTYGVYGSSSSGFGVYGESLADGAVGVQAQADTANGIALLVKGPAYFSRSGVLTVSKGTASVSLSTFLDRGSAVLATIQGNIAGVYVQGVSVTPGSPGSLTIHLNKVAPASVKVAWFAVN